MSSAGPFLSAGLLTATQKLIILVVPNRPSSTDSKPVQPHEDPEICQHAPVICSSELLAVLRVPPNDGGRAKPAQESGTVSCGSANGEGERAVAILGTVEAALPVPPIVDFLFRPGVSLSLSLSPSLLLSCTDVARR